MNVVEPKTKTTLLLNKNYQPFAIITARAAIKHLMSERAKGIDALGNLVSWSGADMEQLKDGTSTLRWFNNEVSLFDNHPCLRSAPDPNTGEDRKWAVPTILVCSYHFGHNYRRGEYVSTKSVYKIYKGICQYCFEKVSLSKATKDHVYPKSKGGSNHDFNIVLACRDCNSKKDNHYPFFDINGNEPKPLKINNYYDFINEHVIIREEWKPFLPITLDSNGTKL